MNISRLQEGDDEVFDLGHRKSTAEGYLHEKQGRSSAQGGKQAASSLSLSRRTCAGSMPRCPPRFQCQ